MRKWLLALLFAGVFVTLLLITSIVNHGFQPSWGANVDDTLEKDRIPVAYESSDDDTQSDFFTGLESLPNSLRNIEVDGHLRAGADGNLILDADVRRVFDFFLNAVGEEPVEQILARLNAYIASVLPAHAAAQAHQVLNEYLDLRNAMSEAERDASFNLDIFSAEQQLSSALLSERKQVIRELRSHHLSPAVDQAFFSDEDEFDDFTIAKLAVIEDTSLSPVQQSERIATLEAGLSLALQEQIASVSRYQTLSRLVDEWDAMQGDASSLRQIRENLVGSAAADRLEQLDQRRSVWRARVDSWLAERDAILADDRLSLQDRQTEVERLRLQRFDATQLKRLESLEEMHSWNAARKEE